MAVFIIKAQYNHEDEEHEYENVYVGVNGEEAFSLDANDVTSLYMEIWVANQIFSRQERFPNQQWQQTYNALEEYQEMIKAEKKALKEKEAKLLKMRQQAQSEGVSL